MIQRDPDSCQDSLLSLCGLYSTNFKEVIL